MTEELKLPPLPNPFTVASTIKCTSCGAPYEPVRVIAPMAAAAANFPWMVPPQSCKCGSTQFGGTFGCDSPSPAQFTADQMQDYAHAANAEAQAIIERLERDKSELSYEFAQAMHRCALTIDRLTRERDDAHRAIANMLTLRLMAKAVVDRWDTPLWKDAPATGGYINRLRDALASFQLEE